MSVALLYLPSGSLRRNWILLSFVQNEDILRGQRLSVEINLATREHLICMFTCTYPKLVASILVPHSDPVHRVSFNSMHRIWCDAAVMSVALLYVPSVSSRRNWILLSFVQNIDILRGQVSIWRTSNLHVHVRSSKTDRFDLGSSFRPCALC